VHQESSDSSGQTCFECGKLTRSLRLIWRSHLTGLVLCADCYQKTLSHLDALLTDEDRSAFGQWLHIPGGEDGTTTHEQARTT